MLFNNKPENLMNKIKKYILPGLLYSAAAVALYFIYQTQIKVINQDVSARDIDPNCDIVMFSTSYCPYCEKAKKFFAENGVAYCDRDIEFSDEDAKLFRELGGKGTPLTIIGNTVLGGFVEKRYQDAFDKL